MEWWILKSVALRKAKIVYNFGLSECNIELNKNGVVDSKV